MHCDEVMEQADAYGLGALDPDERDLLDRHAETCAACRLLLDEATLDAAQLALATPLQRAPQALRARLMRQLTEEGKPGWRPSMPQRFTGASSNVPVSRRGGRPVWQQAAAASVAAVVLLGAAIWIAGLQMQVNRLQGRSQTLQRGMTDFESQRAALMLLASDGTSRFPMQPTDPSTGAKGAVIWNRDQRKCSIFVTGLPAPSADQVYHVWLVGGDRSWDQGELNSGGRGTAEKSIDLSRYANQAGYQLVVSLQNRQPGSGEWHPILRAWVGD